MSSSSCSSCRELRLGRGLYAGLLRASLLGPVALLTANVAGAGLGWLELIAALSVTAGLLGVGVFMFAAEARACWARLRRRSELMVRGWTPRRVAFVTLLTLALAGLAALVPALFVSGISTRAYLVLASFVLGAAFAAFVAWTRGLDRAEAWALIVD
ncbi:MAG TPA: hypothetical protein VF216_01530 [Mizugakiibacter sp.]